MKVRFSSRSWVIRENGGTKFVFVNLRPILAAAVIALAGFVLVGCNKHSTPTAPSTPGVGGVSWISQIPVVTSSIEYGRNLHLSVRYFIAEQDRVRANVLVSCYSLDGANILEYSCSFRDRVVTGTVESTIMGAGAPCEFIQQGITHANYIIHFLTPRVRGQGEKYNDLVRTVEHVVSHRINFLPNPKYPELCGGQ